MTPTRTRKNSYPWLIFAGMGTGLVGYPGWLASLMGKSLNLLLLFKFQASRSGLGINKTAPRRATFSRVFVANTHRTGSSIFFFHFSFLSFVHDILFTTITTMFAAASIAVDPTLLVLRVLSPSLVLFITISLFTTRPPPPSSPSPITSVVVATRVPRRALILSCLSLSSFTYLLDGLAFVIYAVINKYWPPRTGMDINSFVGLVAFSGLAALGSWKDVKGADVWSLK